MIRYVLIMSTIWVLLIQLMPDKLADIRIIPITIFGLVAWAGVLEIKGKLEPSKPHKKTSKKDRPKKEKDDIPADPNMHKIRATQVRTSSSNPQDWGRVRTTQPVQLDLFGNAVPLPQQNHRPSGPTPSLDELPPYDPYGEYR